MSAPALRARASATLTVIRRPRTFASSGSSTAAAPLTTQPDPGEYLGADGAGCEYFARGGHIHAHEPGSPATRHRGRLASFNRMNRRHLEGVAT